MNLSGRITHLGEVEFPDSAKSWDRTRWRLREKAAYPAYPQITSLREHLGDLTQHVIETMLEPKNWFDFSQQVRVEEKLFRVPEYPNIGFLLKHRNTAVKVMRWDLRAWLRCRL